MLGVLISWILSALVLWVLSLVLPGISFDGGVISISFLITAVVIGLINALLVPLVKNIVKTQNAILLFVISLVVDAAALMFAAWLPIGFGITFVAALIAAAVLSLLNLGASNVNFDKKK